MTSTCTICGTTLVLFSGQWWDDGGWAADARNGQPWHAHQAAADAAPDPAPEEPVHAEDCDLDDDCSCGAGQ